MLPLQRQQGTPYCLAEQETRNLRRFTRGQASAVQLCLIVSIPGGIAVRKCSSFRLRFVEAYRVPSKLTKPSIPSGSVNWCQAFGCVE